MIFKLVLIFHLNYCFLWCEIWRQKPVKMWLSTTGYNMKGLWSSQCWLIQGFIVPLCLDNENKYNQHAIHFCFSSFTFMEGFLVLYFFFLTEVSSLPKYPVPRSYCVDLGGSNFYLDKDVDPLLPDFNLWRKAIKLPLPLYGCLERFLVSALSSFIINQIIRVIFPACCAAGDTKPMTLLTEVHIAVDSLPTVW